MIMGVIMNVVMRVFRGVNLDVIMCMKRAISLSREKDYSHTDTYQLSQEAKPHGPKRNVSTISHDTALK